MWRMARVLLQTQGLEHHLTGPEVQVESEASAHTPYPCEVS